jgi:hypothetical protein
MAGSERRRPRRRVPYLRRALDEPIGDDERAALLVELGAIELNVGSASTVEHFRKRSC